jgi:hypothetical protein
VTDTTAIHGPAYSLGNGGAAIAAVAAAAEGKLGVASMPGRLLPGPLLPGPLLLGTAALGFVVLRTRAPAFRAFGFLVLGSPGAWGRRC